MTETSRVRLAFLILAVFVLMVIAARCVSASTTPIPTSTPFDASKIDYSQFTPDEIARTEAHREQLKDQHNQQLEHVGEVAKAQGVTLNEVQVALSEAKSSFETYQIATEAQIEKGNKAIAALDHVIHQLHVAKFIMCGLWIAAVAFLAMKIPPPLSLYLGGGLAVAGVAVIWMFL